MDNLTLLLSLVLIDVNHNNKKDKRKVLLKLAKGNPGKHNLTISRMLQANKVGKGKELLSMLVGDYMELVHVKEDILAQGGSGLILSSSGIHPLILNYENEEEDKPANLAEEVTLTQDIVSQLVYVCLSKGELCKVLLFEESGFSGEVFQLRV